MSEKVLNEESSDIDKILPYIKNLKKNADSLVKQNQSLENSLAKLQASNLFLKKELDSKTIKLKVYQELVNGYKKSTVLLNKIILEYQ